MTEKRHNKRGVKMFIFIGALIALFIICVVIFCAAGLAINKNNPKLAFYYFTLLSVPISVGIALISKHYEWTELTMLWTIPILVGLCCLVIGVLFKPAKGAD